MPKAKCTCPTTSDEATPLWSLCDKDCFCPWCGGQIRELTSDNFFSSEDGRKLVLYPSRMKEGKSSLEFRATLALNYHDDRHQPQIETCDIPAPPENGILLTLVNRATSHHWQAIFETAKSPPKSSIVFRPKDGQSSHIKDIPDQGLEGELTLRGDFPEENWPFLLCKSPNLVCSLKGRGVRPRNKALFPEGTADSDPDASYWEITDFSLLRLSLVLEVEKAPFYVAATPHGSDGDDDQSIRSPVRFRVKVIDDNQQVKQVDEFKEHHATQGKTSLVKVERVLRTGQFVASSTRERRVPLIIPLQLNCSDLKADWTLEFSIEIDRAGEPAETLAHVLHCRCVDLGKIRVDPSQLSLNCMYEGEYRSNAANEPLTNPEVAAPIEIQRELRLRPVIDTVDVNNGGSNIVTLQSVIEGGGGDWIRTGWDVDSSLVDSRIDSKDPSKLTLKKGENCRLLVELDFRNKPAQREPLMARIVLYDADQGNERTIELGDLSVLIQRVEERKPTDSPLFLDFGNSNSTAAVLIKSASGMQAVRPGHDYGNSEHFPTVLLLQRIDPEEKLRSETLIGPFATKADEMTRGPDNASRLVSGLKQRLCGLVDEGFASEIPCVDLSNAHVWMSSTELLTLFLRDMVNRAEMLLRGERITRLVISYPSRLAPRQRREYFTAFEQACARISDERTRPDCKMQLEQQIKVDEANAVALGFAYTSEKRYRDLITECLQRQKNHMNVVAIDLGGGSLDIASLKFENKSRLTGVPRWKSTYLWIGGDSEFGGNNLTSAAFELLRVRLKLIPAKLKAFDEHFHGPLVSLEMTCQKMIERVNEIPNPDDYFSGRAAEKAARFLALWSAAELVKLNAITSRPTPDDRGLRRQLISAFRLEPGELDHFPMEFFWVSQKELETHTIECDQHGNRNYNIVDRLESAIQQLAIHLSDLNHQVDFMVISGGASPWVRLQETVKSHFPPPTTVIFDPLRLKSRVAEGLALAWNSLSTPGEQNRPACSGNYTTAEIGVLDPYTLTPHSLFPICTPLKQGALELRLREQFEVDSVAVLQELRRPLNSEIENYWELVICRITNRDAGEWETLGRFIAGPESNLPPETDWKRINVKFGNDEDEMELEIEYSQETAVHAETSISTVPISDELKKSTLPNPRKSIPLKPEISS